MKRNKSKYIFVILVLFFLSVKTIMATTIRETLNSGDGYDTIAPNTFIIGITKFSGDEVITASKAATAGANDAMFYAMKNGTTKGYKAPTIYYYVDANVGWFQFDSNNIAKPVTDQETINKLSNLDIYYVNNVEKKLDVSYSGASIKTELLEDGVEYKDNKLLVDATKLNFQIETTSGKKISYVVDETTSSFVEDISSCFTVDNGVITDYDASCGSNITIPKSINGVEITGIAANAFNNKRLVKVVVPSGITSIGDSAFLNNDLESVTFDEKYDDDDFKNYSENAFPEDTVIHYDNVLTRRMESIPDKYSVKVYSELDLTNIDTETLVFNAVFKEINTEKYNFQIDGSELNKTYMIHFPGIYDDDEKCYDNLGNSFYIYFTLEEGNKHYIHFEKKLNNCTRIVSARKEFKVTFEKTGTISDKNSVDRAISTLPKNGTDTNNDIVIRRRDLEDFVDENKFDYLFGSQQANILDPVDGVSGSLISGNLFLFKNDILYSVIENFSVSNLSNGYYPKISLDDYEDEDAFIQETIHQFEEKTGIDNYIIMNLGQNKDYAEIVTGATRQFYVGIFDKDSSEYWTINVSAATEDVYDDLGYTKASCFTVDNGIITKYNGLCGANVKIPDTIDGKSVTEIGNSVFYNYGLNSVTLPSTLKSIQSDAFNSNHLKELTLPNSVTTVGWSAFANNQIKTLNLSTNISNIESLSFANNQIQSLSFNSSLQYIGAGAFSNNQLDDEHAFIYGRKLRSDNTTYMSDNTILVSYAGKNRDNITIPNTVTQISSYAFYHLGLTNIEIPYGIKSIGSYAFDSNKLTTISVPNSVENFGFSVFSGNKFVNDNCFIYARDRDGNIDKSTLVSYSFYNKNPNYSYEIKKLTIPTTVKKIGMNAFYGKESIYIDELVIPYGVEEIDDYAFLNVVIKNQFSLPKSLKEVGTNIFSSFYSANDEKAFIYGQNEDGTIDKGTLMGYVGYESESQLILPSNIKKIGSKVFSAKPFTSVKLNDGLEEIGESAFANMYNLHEINIPSSVKIIGKKAFADNNNLKKLTLNQGLEEIKDNAFENHHFNEISIPSSVKKIGNYSFYKGYFSSTEDILKTVTLNEGIEEIGEHAFESSTSLEEISIPSTVKKVGINAFGYVENVKIYGKTSLDEFDGGFYLGSYDVNIEFINE